MTSWLDLGFYENPMYLQPLNTREKLSLFVGRKKELEELKRRIFEQSLPLVVEGWDGTGKTTFMNKVAFDLENAEENAMPDNIFVFVDFKEFLGMRSEYQFSSWKKAVKKILASQDTSESMWRLCQKEPFKTLINLRKQPQLLNSDLGKVLAGSLSELVRTIRIVDSGFRGFIFVIDDLDKIPVFRETEMEVDEKQQEYFDYLIEWRNNVENIENIHTIYIGYEGCSQILRRRARGFFQYPPCILSRLSLDDVMHLLEKRFSYYSNGKYSRVEELLDPEIVEILFDCSGGKHTRWILEKLGTGIGDCKEEKPLLPLALEQVSQPMLEELDKLFRFEPKLERFAEILFKIFAEDSGDKVYGRDLRFDSLGKTSKWVGRLLRTLERNNILFSMWEGRRKYYRAGTDLLLWIRLSERYNIKDGK